MRGDTTRGFRRWLWRPPRPHGQVVAHRNVSFLELFYDLVYVAVIAQAAHHLAEHVTVRGFIEFAVIFSLIWVAWVNGSLYVEQHGRNDGRTRSLIFAQMAVLALLAVFTADAVGEAGPMFAVVYAAFLALMTWQWHAVRGEDDAEFMVVTGVYEAGMVVSTVAMLGSALLPADARLVVWAGFSLGWFIGIGLARAPGLAPTESLVERFGLFTIIVLGEVIFGVIDGLSVAKPDLTVIVTGILALMIGFGFWWIYFDVVGRRLPRTDGRSLANWLLSHFPITLAIAAAGAGMTGLIEQAHDSSTEPGTAWLLAGAVALGLLSLVVIERSLADAERLRAVYRPLGPALVGGAIAALVIGWLQPTPWLLAVSLVGVLGLLWVFVVYRLIGQEAWEEASVA